MLRLLAFSLLVVNTVAAQTKADPWIITANPVNIDGYYGVTVGNE